MKVRAGWQKHGSWYWVRPGFRPTAANKAENREIVYNQIIIRLMKTMLRFQVSKCRLRGVRIVPDTGGALLALNHTGYFDLFSGARLRICTVAGWCGLWPKKRCLTCRWWGR